MGQRQRAQATATRAMPLSGTRIEQHSLPNPEVAVKVQRGVER